MLKNTFDPKLKYKAVVYGRMSSDLQNPRSPEQQFDEIDRLLKANGREWRIVKKYRDGAISGRYIGKRQGYQTMLRDLKTGKVKADLILVDTLERFGRGDDLTVIRKDLHEKHGVLVLTADSNFADPNTTAGRALGMVEALRASEDGRVKAHNVLRGKRDCVQQKRWPGGAAPFGFKLQSVMKSVKGRDEVDHCLLVPEPTTAWIIKLLFETAEKTAWGTIRLARFLNAREDIPDNFKPFQPETIGRWLDKRLYYGEMVWNVHSTGIIDDARAVVANPDDELVHVPEFCEPLVTQQQWQNVQALRAARRARMAKPVCESELSDGKLLMPLSPGLALKHLLSGLLYCECGLRMTASSTSAYITAAGDERRYTSYVCPGYLGGHCENDTRVPEEWVHKAVVDALRDQLFPCEGS